MKYYSALLFIIMIACQTKVNTSMDFTKRPVDHHPNTAPLTPTESIKKIQVPPGYTVELVAAEPLIQDPVALAWDGDGAMYVVQMNTFMTDAKGTDQYAPISQIRRLVDTDWDGVMDVSTVFIDSLVLPRVILPVGNELIVGITNVQHLYAYKDTNGDGRADQKRIVYENHAIDARNMEHQNGGLLWNMDNWIYPSRDNLRFKYKNGILKVDTMIDNMIGQWGMTTDDYGRLFYSEAGPGLPVVQFNQMPAYGSLNFSDQYPDDFTMTWPILSTIDAQGGPDVLRKNDSTLQRFTSGCGQSIFRGDRLPDDLRGDYFIPEPVARIIKRGEVINRKGKRFVENVYREKEWLASSDFNFRPVNTYTGPDGCFYIVDMYRGIVQEGEFAEEDSYLNKKIKELGLEKNKGFGRIYRVVHQDYTRDEVQPKLLNKSSKDLVPYLSHANGWWRDMAQQLLVIRGDTSIKAPLEKIVTDNLQTQQSHLSALHALWTLEGLNAIDQTLILKATTSVHPQIRKASIWIGEQWIKNNDRIFIKSLDRLKNDTDPDVLIQLYLSLRTNTTHEAQSIVDYILYTLPHNEVIKYAHTVFKESNARAEVEKRRIHQLSDTDRKLVTQGATIFKQLCASCHGIDGKGAKQGEIFTAPPLAGSPRVNGDKIMLIQIVLFGLKGPLDGKTYPGTMLPNKHQSDEWIASVLSYIRNSADLGNKSSIVSKEEVEDIRATASVDHEIPDLRLLEIYKLGRGEAQNWSSGKPGSGGKKWGGHFRSMVKDSLK